MEKMESVTRLGVYGLVWEERLRCEKIREKNETVLIIITTLTLLVANLPQAIQLRGRSGHSGRRRHLVICTYKRHREARK